MRGDQVRRVVEFFSARSLLAVCLTGALPLTGPAVRGQQIAASEPAAQPDEKCPPDEIEKDELCGFARAAIARMEYEKTLEPSQLAALLEAQTDTDITHCFLDIEVILGNPNRITGSNTLDVTSKSNGLTQFTLNLKSNMTVTSVLVNGSAASFTRPTDEIVITLDHAYSVGQTFQVKVSYNGTPSAIGMDSASFTFRTHGSPSKTIVSSLSQPYYAYTWWPCKEDLVSNSDKFTMDLWVTAPNTYIVASNGTQQGIDALSGNRNRTAGSRTIPTRLTASAWP